MISLMSLWIPILLATAICWIAGALLWMVLPHHKSEYARVANEDAARDALRGLQAGLYNIPHVVDPSNMTDEEKKKFEDGPLAYVTVVDNGLPNMGKNLALQLGCYLLVSILVAYVASAALPAGTSYLKVFQVTGATAWLAYGFSGLQDSVWFGKPWSVNIKVIADALVYGLLTAGVFGWLWP